MEMSSTVNLLHPSTLKALNLLRQFLSTRSALKAEPIPSVKSLSRSFGVGSLHLCAALRVLEREGLIHVVRGRGIFIGPRPISSFCYHKPKWRKIMEQIYVDFCEGLPQNLPSIRELCRRYEAGYYVLKRALCELVRRGTIIKRGIRYYSVRLSRTPHRSSLCFIGPGDPSGRILLLNSRFVEVLNELEYSCNRKNLTLIHSGLYSELSQAMLQKMEDSATVIGYIIWSNAIAPTLLKEVLSVVTKSKRPVAIIDEMGDPFVAQAAANYTRCKVFTIAGFSAGEEVARTLNRLGHCRIAYCSSHYDALWSKRRFEGIRSIFDDICGYVELNIIQQTIPPNTPSISAKCRSILTEAGIQQPGIYEQLLGNVVLGIWGIIELDMLCKTLTPDIERLLDNGIRVFVMENDRLALALLVLIQQKGISSLSHISIVGFDDTPEALRFGLTSYNFAFPSIASRALRFVLEPTYTPDEDRLIECPGFINIRKSLWPATSSHVYK